MQQKCMTMFSSVCSVDLYWLTSVGQPTVVESGIWGSGGYCAVSHGQATRMSLCVCVCARTTRGGHAPHLVGNSKVSLGTFEYVNLLA